MAWNQFPPYELAVIFDVLHGRRQQFLERAPMFGRPTAPRHTLTEVPATENGRSQQNVPLKCIVQPLCVHLALRTLWHENWRRATKSTRVTVHLRKCVENGALRGCQQRHHVQTAKRILRRRRGSTTKAELYCTALLLCVTPPNQAFAFPHRAGGLPRRSKVLRQEKVDLAPLHRLSALLWTKSVRSTRAARAPTRYARGLEGHFAGASQARLGGAP